MPVCAVDGGLRLQDDQSAVVGENVEACLRSYSRIFTFLLEIRWAVRAFSIMSDSVLEPGETFTA